MDYYCPTKKGDLSANVVENACPIGQVSKFCIAALRRLLPAETWGSAQNYNLFKNSKFCITGYFIFTLKLLVLVGICDFLKLGRFDSLSLHHVLHGIEFTDIPCLYSSAKNRFKVKRSLLEREHAKFIFWYFMNWLWNKFLPSILSGHFYVTESAHSRNLLYYFRLDNWQEITRSTVNLFKTQLCDPCIIVML